MGVCNCSMFCYTLLYVHSSIAIILMGKRELIALLNLSSWCLMMVGRLFLAVPRGCLQFVIVVFPDHTHLLFFTLQASELRLYTSYFTLQSSEFTVQTSHFIFQTSYFTLHTSQFLIYDVLLIRGMFKKYADRCCHSLSF